MHEIEFKKAVYSAKSREELTQNIYDYWNNVKVGDEILLRWFDNKPKYQQAVDDTIHSLYQQKAIHAIRLTDRIRRTF